MPAHPIHPRPIRPASALALSLLLLGACSPLTEQEQAYFENRRELERQEQVLSTALTAGEAYSEHIQKVQDQPAPEGDGTTGQWIADIPRREKGDLWFGRWQAKATGASLIEVRYTYTLVDEEYNSREKGYRWVLNTVVDSISGPDPLGEDDLKSRHKRSLTPREQQKERTREFSLE